MKIVVNYFFQLSIGRIGSENEQKILRRSKLINFGTGYLNHQWAYVGQKKKPDAKNYFYDWRS